MNIKQKFELLTYNVGIVKKDAESFLKNGIDAGEIKWLKHNYKDRYFADPFVIDEDEKYLYILVEEYCFWEEKGKIVLLTVNKDNFTLKSRKLIIEETTHLSFPFCEKGGYTIIPESVKSGKTKKYFYDRNTKSIIQSEVILNEGLIDASFYVDKENNEWIFASKENNPKEDLYIYKKVGEEYECINNGKPVERSIRTTRSAGRFFEVENQIYRPVQDSQGRYGRQTVILKVKKLNESAYETEEVITVNSFKNPPYNETLHTLNIYDKYIIVDGSKDVLRFPMKLFYKKLKFLFNKRKITCK